MTHTDMMTLQCMTHSDMMTSQAAQAERDAAIEKQEAMQRRMDAIIAEASKSSGESAGDGEGSVSGVDSDLVRNLKLLADENRALADANDELSESASPPRPLRPTSSQIPQLEEALAKLSVAEARLEHSETTMDELERTCARGWGETSIVYQHCLYIGLRLWIALLLLHLNRFGVADVKMRLSLAPPCPIPDFMVGLG